MPALKMPRRSILAFDNSGQYFANVISRPGRNEIQLFNIVKALDASGTEDSLPISSQALQISTEESVSSIEWCYSNPVSAALTPSKKRSSGSSANSTPNGKANGSSRSLYLLIACEGGNVLTYSPEVSEVVFKVESDLPNANISSSEKKTGKNSFWVVKNQLPELLEYQLGSSNNKPVKTVNLEHEVSIAVSVKSKGRSQIILVAKGPEISLLDVLKATQPVEVIKFQSADVGSIIQIRTHNTESSTIVAVLRENSSKIEVFDIKSAQPIAFAQASDNVKGIKFVGSSLLAFASSGVDIFDVEGETVNSEARAHLRTSQANTPIQDVVVSPEDENKLVVAWYNENEPFFAAVEWNASISGEIVVQNSIQSGLDDVYDEEDLPIRKVKVNNISGEVLKSLIEENLSKLNYLKRAASTVLEVCQENADASNIKAVVQDLSDTAVVNLFTIVSEEVAQKASRTPNLAIWLKWLLLAHGGNLVQSTDRVENLKSLQKGLDSGLQLLPKLLAFRGRLSMLKQQQELRNAVEDDEDLKEENGEIENVDDSVLVDHSMQEESIIFANGENDEDVTGAEDK